MNIKTITFIAFATTTVANQAATLSLTNADFEGGQVPTTNNPTSWTTTESHGGAFYAEDWGAGAGYAATLNMQARPLSTVEQSFLTGEATADSYPTIEITMDFGTRANSGTARNVTVEIWNVTDGVSLASEVYNFPTTGTGFIENKTFSLSYDNTVAGIVGDTIALRLTSNGTDGDFATTHWVDNISVNAVPEPSSTALLGLGGLALILRRRK